MTLSPLNVLVARSILAVCAHPDDESFGLGGILATLRTGGATTHLLCFTTGEASTLGADIEDLAGARTKELTAAGAALGLTSIRLSNHRDGHLAEADFEELISEVQVSAGVHDADCLLVFDEGGITGHPDHQRATRAALAAGVRLGLPVVAWTLPSSIATILHDEFGAEFVGVPSEQIDIRLHVDRATQRAAIACHNSQAPDNPVLRRRLELQGDVESLRWLHRPHSDIDR